jgi:aspartyl-tRNA(Asn)/glutamyl-tRNA(Gln) amidotransferase subunit B
MNSSDRYETIIGLEVHAQLATASKLFCSDTTTFGLPSNTQVSAISLGHPGTLPKLNKEAIRLAISLGLATHSQIVQHNYFARKNYFYPDLPKGYQITQHTTPICKGGFVEITVGKDKKAVQLNRIHIEEDAGKSVHDGESGSTQLDFNRAGMPLVEIVTEPDLRSAEEAACVCNHPAKISTPLRGLRWQYGRRQFTMRCKHFSSYKRREAVGNQSGN